MTIIVRGFLGPLTLTRGYGSTAGPPLVVYVDPRACQLVSSASDSDFSAIDPRACQLVTSSSDGDPFGVDPRAAQLVS
jgi:hypothetical protein